MSSWGITNFENDVALDYVAELVLSHDQLQLSSEIDQFNATFNSEETSLDECLLFLTKMELLAGLIGSPSVDMPLELKDWIEGKYIKVEQKVLKNAVQGVQKVLTDSEAKEMYLEGGSIIWDSKNLRKTNARLVVNHL